MPDNSNVFEWINFLTAYIAMSIIVFIAGIVLGYAIMKGTAKLILTTIIKYKRNAYRKIVCMKGKNEQ